MLKKFAQRVGINFKHSKSERAAGASYSNYHQNIKRIFFKVNPFKKGTKYGKS